MKIVGYALKWVKMKLNTTVTGFAALSCPTQIPIVAQSFKQCSPYRVKNLYQAIFIRQQCNAFILNTK